MTNAANLAAVASTTYGYANATKLQSGGVTTNALAWVNFNGSTAAIRASYNVSSITRSSAGSYTVNFTNVTSDANYAVSGAIQNQTGSNWSAPIQFFSSGYSSVAPTTSGFVFQVLYNGFGGYYDPTYCNIVVFGN